MSRPSARTLRFVRALLAGGVAIRQGESLVMSGAAAIALPLADVRPLLASGLLVGDERQCRAGAEARAWIKRQMIDADAYAAQHRVEARRPDGTRINLAESPLARLAAPAGSDGAAFLMPHQVEAGERLRRLVQRAGLQPRLTMNYSADHTAGGGARHAADISDMAADARRTLAEIAAVLPRDCAGVVMDVCGLLKGLQAVEVERGWPRRSAKLVLRIGLEQLAQYFGLAPVATGIETRRRRSWLDEGARPAVFE